MNLSSNIYKLPLNLVCALCNINITRPLNSKSKGFDILVIISIEFSACRW